jgi:selenide,water dikinase
VGGGHAHVGVLKFWGMNPMSRVRLTLVSSQVNTPYSGMLPGLISGHYAFDQTHLDLWKLARATGVRCVLDRVLGVDLDGRRVICADRPPIPYDVLSLNIGSTPQVEGIPGAAEHAIPVKPIEKFLPRWQEVQRRVEAWTGERFRIGVVGGGAGGVELLLSMQHRLKQTAGLRPGRTVPCEFTLVTESPELLASHNANVRRRFERVLRERGVRVELNQRIVQVSADRLRSASGMEIGFDALFWVTTASAQAWVRDSGLATDDRGFVAVNECLQSTSHANVFAAGDVAAVLPYPRPKAGVFAVRQGKPLAENLRRALEGSPLRPFRPQSQFLSLVSTGDRHAVASRGSLALEGDWVWRWKNSIDVNWMRQYQELEPGSMPAKPLAESSVSASMRCAGCGGKVGGDVLARVLKRVGSQPDPKVLVGLAERRDASVVAIPAGQILVQSVDYFRFMFDDPYLCGRIAANHALNDLYAMGARPHSGLVIASLPFEGELEMEETLFQTVSGAHRELEQAGALLIGGHSAEGSEPSIGLMVQGTLDGSASVALPSWQSGDHLILTKPLGTGMVFAGHQAGLVKGEWVERSIANALLSNQRAALCLQEYGVRAMTDVSGFGLVRHLLELRRPSSLGVTIDLGAIPALPGALELLARGVTSSLASQNRAIGREIVNHPESTGVGRYELLFDPQTAGGLVGVVPDAVAKDAVKALRDLGYGEAVDIGVVGDFDGRGEGRTVRVVGG